MLKVIGFIVNIIIWLLILIMLSKRTQTVYIFYDPEITKTVDSLRIKLDRIDGIIFQLQTIYWDSHPKDRGKMLPLMNVYAIDSNVVKKLKKLKGIKK